MEYRAAALEADEPGGDETLNDASVSIKRFADLDPTSQGFRYPLDRQGQVGLPPDLLHVNLRQVRDVVERLSGFFDGAEAQIDALLEYKWDAEEEGRAVEREMEREILAEYSTGG
jgi:hypothetical protein